MADTYIQSVLENSPPWLQGPNGKAFLLAMASQKDWAADLVREAVRARFPGTVTPIVRRTNLCPASTSPATWPLWSIGNTLTANAAVAPDGTTTAARLDYSGAGTTGDLRMYQGPATLTSPGQPYTFSLWMRANTGATRVRLGSNLGSITVCDLTSTWQRFTLTALGNGSSYPQLMVYSDVGSNAAFSIFIWGGQIEASAVATNYIPNATGGSATAEDFTPLAPADALPLIGTERMLARGVGETEGQYRARLIAALDAWRWAGTPYGLLRALQLAGYPSVQLQCQTGVQYTLTGATGTTADLASAAMPAPVHLGGSPQELWSDIGILITKPWPTWWSGVAPADGSSDCLTVKALISAWKGAWNRCIKLNVVSGPVWGAFTWGAFTWGSGTVTVWTPPSG